MFELSVARKYLIPRRKHLSVSLIALLSVAVISLVVWLLLVFLSVTDGLEKKWLDKLTSLNAPMRITPTSHYYDSYYYHIDGLAAAGGYRLRSLGEKAEATLSDPYDPTSDQQIPTHWKSAEKYPDGSLKDPVKTLFNTLSMLKEAHPDLIAEEYEMSGALLRLRMLRKDPHAAGVSQNLLTQVSYVASFSEKSPYLASLCSAPSQADLNHLFYLAQYHADPHFEEGDHSLTVKSSQVDFREQTRNLLEHITIEELKTSAHYWRLPSSLIPTQSSLPAMMEQGVNLRPYFIVCPKNQAQGTVRQEGSKLIFTPYKGDPVEASLESPILTTQVLSLKADLIPSSLDFAKDLKDLRFTVCGLLQGVKLQGTVAWDGLEISKAHLKEKSDLSPPWFQRTLPHIPGKGAGILLAKSFQENGVRIGDQGYLSYSSASLSSVQEQRLSVFVAGFYDPGIMSVGNKCILTTPDIPRLINASTTTYALDKTQTNGIQVWFKNLNEARVIQMQIQKALEQSGVGHFWKVSTFHEYDFARDLMQQFQSDKYLFTLVGVIILLVGCSNIISLLVLLVNDKKKEIGILQSMGASARSIAAIFGICGVAMGLLSTLIGTLAAFLTLQHLDSLVHLLSLVQGHDAFNALFYGTSLPNQMSSGALLFILIATPLLSLLAGLIPAIKAARLRPSVILRSE